MLLVCVVCLCVTYATATEEYSVRLVNGAVPYEGILEVYHDGGWDGVCGYNGWDEAGAQVVCRQLGYAGGIADRGARYIYGERREGMLLHNFQCNGTEDRLADCRLNTGPNCGPDDDAGVRCSAVRLMNTNSLTEGRVQVIHNGVWTDVCGDGWDDIDAAVVCKELQYEGGVAWLDDGYESNNNTLWLSGVNCNGTEGSITECQHGGWEISDSNSTTHAAVTCNSAVRLADGSVPWKGRVEVYRRGQWMTICSRYWGNEDAQVICRELGYTGGEAYIRPWNGEGTGEVWQSEIHCNGSESRLADCSVRGLYFLCSDFLDVSVLCTSARLTSSNISSHGTVQVYRNGMWGNVCGDGWDDVDAAVVCRELQYPGGVAEIDYDFDENNTTWLLNDVTCNGTEGGVSLCSHSGGDSSGCNSKTYAAAKCNSGTRLVNGSVAWRGRVELFYDEEWRTVCSYSFGPTEARVLCREFGYAGGLLQQYLPQSDRGTGKQLYPGMGRCDGTETSIRDCYLGEWQSITYWESCSYDTGLSCSKARIVGGEGSAVGRLQVYHNGAWGEVCGDGWDDLDAAVVCRELQYMGGVARLDDGYDLNNSPVWLSDVACNGTEEGVSLCAHTGWGTSSSCNNTYAAVTCTGSVRLVNGSGPWEGRVEVLYEDVWGRVCDNSWYGNIAWVVCEELGYTNGQQHRLAAYGRGRGRVWLTGLSCRSENQRLIHCPHNPWGEHDDSDGPMLDIHVHCIKDCVDNRITNCRSCAGSDDRCTLCYTGYILSDDRDECINCEDAISNCRSCARDRCTSCDSNYSLSDDGKSCIYDGPFVRLVDGNSSRNGRLQVYHNGAWGEVCGDGWDDLDAAVVCRELQYIGGVAWTIGGNDVNSNPVWLSDVACSGTEGNVTLCSHTGWGTSACGDSMYAAVQCDFDVRVAGGSQPWEGHVEVYYNGSWGTVCGSWWDSANARVVCRELGYDYGEAHIYADLDDGSGEIWLSWITCNGREERLQDCGHNGWGGHGNICFHYAGVYCIKYCDARAIRRCKTCAHESDTCSACRDQFVFNENHTECIACRELVSDCRYCTYDRCTECDVGYFYREDSNSCCYGHPDTCSVEIEHCKCCYNDECTACEDGFIISDDRRSCISKACLEIRKYCQSCAEGVCTSCKEGFGVSDDGRSCTPIFSEPTAGNTTDLESDAKSDGSIQLGDIIGIGSGVVALIAIPIAIVLHIRGRKKKKKQMKSPMPLENTEQAQIPATFASKVIFEDVPQSIKSQTRTTRQISDLHT